MKKLLICDILQELHSKQILKPEEKVIAIFDCALLTERFTGKRYSYRIIDMNTYETYFLCAKSKQIPQDRHNQLKEKTQENHGDFTVPPSLWDYSNEQRAKMLLTKIFEEIMPSQGMNHRKEQKNLSLTILEALQKEKIALCEAGVGTGKTHAYILASVIHNLFSEQKQSAIISTSSIALQKAITEDYLPQISDFMQSERMIDRSLKFVVRKGKSHYFCLQRAISYKNTVECVSNKNKLTLILNTLMQNGKTLDLDFEPVTSKVKSRICVIHCDKNCGYADSCQYLKFLSRCRTHFYDFQIVNHNLYIADLRLKRAENYALLSEYGQVIVDEAHKLPSTISEMYKLKLTSKQVPSLMKDILKYRNKKLLNHNTLLTVHSEFFRFLNKNKDSTLELSMSDSVFSTITKLQAHLELARVSVEQYRDGTRPIPPHIIRELSDIMEFLGYLSKGNEWIVTFDRKQEVIQILPKKLLDLLYEDFWSTSIPMILTSGTLSVGGDFGYFKAQIGLSKPNHKLTQFTVNSPFDYQNHGILYLPTDIPYHDIGNKEYILDIANRVSDLLKATHGHSLVLFTSYRLMEQVLRFVERKVVDFPFFVAQKGGENVLSDYRKSENGVLFATDSMGEGIDLAGDLLSSVIVVKLPFPIPNPLSNYEYQKSDSYEDFSKNFVIPAMITKLRQWIGRGIRTESDTCVFSILDARATKKYKDEILKSLPTMPVTDKLEDVKKFIAEKKGSDYFDKHN